MSEINSYLVIIIIVLVIIIVAIVSNFKKKKKKLFQITKNYFDYYLTKHIYELSLQSSNIENELNDYYKLLENKATELRALGNKVINDELKIFQQEIDNYQKLKDIHQKFETRFNRNIESIKLIENNLSMDNVTEFIENIFEQNKIIYDSLIFRVINNEKKVNDYKSLIKEKDKIFNELSNSTETSFTKISSLYSDFLLVQYSLSEKYLISKKYPAFVEAKRINELKKETKNYIEQYRQMVYKYEILMNLFPELTDYVDDFSVIQELDNIDNFRELQENYDQVKKYVNKSEYDKLNVDERNQLALDRYIKGKKSKWQIGRDYELFCGYEYEKNNWKVEYFGIEKKLNDMGRDLIAHRNNEIHIIQCKYWSQNKIIHEKHIAQLYGTTIAYILEQENVLNIKPVFITNIELSDRAKLFAKYLKVTVIKKELGDFPRIKCNYGKDEYGLVTKIYHLPFDQQYDKIIMNRKGNFFAYTVKEAVEKGFRRAYRYYGK